jgi:hypothetical protein
MLRSLTGLKSVRTQQIAFVRGHGEARRRRQLTAAPIGQFEMLRSNCTELEPIGAVRVMRAQAGVEPPPGMPYMRTSPPYTAKTLNPTSGYKGSGVTADVVSVIVAFCL